MSKCKNSLVQPIIWRACWKKSKVFGNGNFVVPPGFILQESSRLRFNGVPISAYENDTSFSIMTAQEPTVSWFSILNCSSFFCPVSDSPFCRNDPNCLLWVDIWSVEQQQTSYSIWVVIRINGKQILFILIEEIRHSQKTQVALTPANFHICKFHTTVNIMLKEWPLCSAQNWQWGKIYATFS